MAGEVPRVGEDSEFLGGGLGHATSRRRSRASSSERWQTLDILIYSIEGSADISGHQRCILHLKQSELDEHTPRIVSRVRYHVQCPGPHIM